MWYEKILVPLDGSQLAECVLAHVEKLARGCETREIILIRICELSGIPADYPSIPAGWEEHMEQISEHSLEQCQLYLREVQQRLQKTGTTVNTVTFLGQPAKDIVDYATNNEIDLIVMASHGRSGVSRWAYGSVAEKVFRTTCVPILMIRAPGCATGI